MGQKAYYAPTRALHHRAFVVGAVGFVLVAFAAAGGADERKTSGRQLYLKYCGACHGPEAKGDGIVASFMRVKPPDLTLIATTHGGEFSLEQVVNTIDGREMLRVHGEPLMPVWGEVLSKELGAGPRRSVPIERRVQGRLLSIAEYLESIQAK
jgi:mono/diheme cytochrome c family protein